MPDVDGDKLRRWVQLGKEMDQAQAHIDRLKPEYEELREGLQRQFMASGMQRMTVDGRTVYVSTRVWAKRLGTVQQVCDALKASGHADFVAEGYNHQTVSSLVRDLAKPRDGEQDDATDGKHRLPPEWEDVLSLSEVPTLKSVAG